MHKDKKIKLTKIIATIVKDLGKVESLGKKGSDKRAWYLIEYLSDRFDFDTFFSIVPQKLDGITDDEF